MSVVVLFTKTGNQICAFELYERQCPLMTLNGVTTADVRYLSGS